ncbi:hypothetical protein [Streptomyces sp. NPDC059491]|uniref:hypothetical protein n=1 Tax=Streptomyces sp. NPDC059491 TaxID=3346850 RepID=UPI0036C5DE0C
MRFVLGKREEDGRYPVTVDDAPAGTVHRRHGSWYATVPGHRNNKRFGTRFDAAAFLVELTDSGIRPTIPAPAHTPAPAPGTDSLDSAAGRRATRTYLHLVPDLRLTLPNLVRAVEAMARLTQLGWEPLEGYPGADQPWRMECRLCGWQGRRFWSHLRGRNGDRMPRPVTRHPGCIPVKEMPAALLALAAERTRNCPCEGEATHPTTTSDALDVLGAIGDALESGSTMYATLYARAILEPCPASTLRADLLRHAYTLRSN